MDGGIVDCVLVCEFSYLKNMKNETLLYLYFCNFLRTFALRINFYWLPFFVRHQPFLNVRISKILGTLTKNVYLSKNY
jgi:hypothetical protein